MFSADDDCERGETAERLREEFGETTLVSFAGGGREGGLKQQVAVELCSWCSWLAENGEKKKHNDDDGGVVVCRELA